MVRIFGKKWKTSERNYHVLVEKDAKITMSDGVEISGDIFRPDSEEKFPAILGVHPYTPYQTAPIKPAAFSSVGGVWLAPGEELARGSLEAGDPNFFVRRGYVHAICNFRAPDIARACV